MTLGGSLGLLPITVFSLLPDILVEQPLLPYHISFLLLGIIPLAYGYAILNDPVISSQGKIARSASNVLVFALTGGLFLILLTLTHRLLPDDAFQDPILLTVVFLFFAALYTPAKKAFNQLVNRAFYGGWYDYHSLVIRSTRKLSRTKNKDRLISSILDIMTTMHFPAAAFFLPVGDHLRCQGSLGTFPERISAYTIPRRGALAEHLRRSNQPAWNSRLRQVLVGQPLSDDEKSLLLHKPPGLWVPLVTNGSLRGLLFLESQFAEEWMSSEDMVILATLGTLAALTSENVALLDALERQLALTEQARAELQESRLRLLEGKESERLHLARELHDGPIQDLHGVRLLFAQASSPAAATRGEGLDEKILTIIHGLREICTQLRPPALTYFGLEAAMRSLADQFTASHPQMTFDIAIDDGGLDLSEQASLALYRIYQEALNNIDQHAGASRVSVRYAVSRSGIQLEVRDDGSGFRVPASLLELARQGHLGLLGASERAESIGGALQIVSAPGQGTQILVNVPLNGASEILKSESSPADLQGSRQTSARV